MISVENLKVEFGVKPLFHDVSFVINDRDRIALVGKNGAGSPGAIDCESARGNKLGNGASGNIRCCEGGA